MTISDFVADLRAATPSNAAELAVPNEADIREMLHSYEIRMSQAMRKQLADRRARLEDLAGRKALTSPTAYLDLKRVELDFVRNRLASASDAYLSAHKHAFAKTAAALDAMSPLKVLARGYSVATGQDGAVIKSAQAVSVGDPVHLQLASGALRCVVESKEENHGTRETVL